MTFQPPPLAPSPSFKDQKTGLNVFGILLIVIGAFLALSSLASIATYAMSRTNAQLAAAINGRTLLTSLAMNGALATALVWLGIGSIQAKRWARALGLCLGSLGLVVGLFGCISLAFSLPAMEAMVRQSAGQNGQQMSGAMITVMKVVVGVTSLVFYILIPGALVLFYRRESVRLTCEARDPVPRWTDRCPLPVLALVLVQAFGAFAMIVMLPSYGGAFPVFGVMLKGAAAYALYLIVAALLLYTACGCYRQRALAYWVYVVFVLLSMANGFVSFRGTQIMAYYVELDMPETQLKQMELMMPALASTGFLVFASSCALVFIGFLLWLRRYFTAGK